MNSQIKLTIKVFFFYYIHCYIASSLPDYCEDFHTEPPQGLLLSSGESPAKSSALTTVHCAEVLWKNNQSLTLASFSGSPGCRGITL